MAETSHEQLQLLIEFKTAVSNIYKLSKNSADEVINIVVEKNLFKHAEPEPASFRRNILKVLASMAESAENISIQKQETLESLLEDQNELIDFLNIYKLTFVAKNISDFQTFTSHLKSMHYTLTVVAKNLHQTKGKKDLRVYFLLNFCSQVFNNTYQTGPIRDDIIKTLDNFIHVADRIRQDESFNNSQVKALEDLLVNKHTATGNTINSSATGNRPFDISQTFFAIAAPSMEGKTQSAFVFNRVRPLYFALSESKPLANSSKPQLVYENFQLLTACLKDCAIDDWQLINFSKFTATELISEYSQRNLWTLGFLMKLVEESANMPSNEVWMKFHSTRPGFKFAPAKIANVPSGFFKEYILVLDEFIANDYFVYVRNLARVVGLTCLVSNTNTKVANVVGKSNASGGSGHSVWSYVLTKLDPITRQFMDAEHGLNDLINNLTLNRPQNDRIRSFLQDFRQEQLKNLRPGVAIFVVEILKELAQHDEIDFIRSDAFKFGEFMNFVVRRLSCKLGDRKSTLLSSATANLGKMALILPESYAGFTKHQIEEVPDLEEDATTAAMFIEEGEEDICDEFEDSVPDEFSVEGSDSTGDYIEDESKFFNQKRFLEDHLFYLCNPQNPDSSYFMTFSPRLTESKGCLEYFTTDASVLATWKHEYTNFNPCELFTILGCLFIPFRRTVSRFLLEAREEQEKLAASTTNSQNSKSSKFVGNIFEVSSAACIVDSSQHDTSRIFSFTGQPGNVFIKNIIFNLILNKQFEWQTQSITVDIHPNLENFLNNTKIPFLYAINFFNEEIEKFSSYTDGFYLENYIRTSDAQQIDGKFNFVSNVIESRQGVVVCECKNWKLTLGTGKLCLIIQKALRVENVQLSLVFCNNLVSRTTTKSKFSTFCSEKKINVYRIEKVSLNNFKIVPFSESFNIIPDAEFNCIVIETNGVNLTKKKYKKIN